MNINLALARLFPSAKAGVDYILRDDGNGQFIESWNLSDPIPTDEQIQITASEQEKSIVIAQYDAAVQQRLDNFARTRNYDGILSAATYATSTAPKFKAEGQYAVEARDATWAKCYEVLAEVEAGTRPIPTIEEFIAELPVLTWPN